MHQYKAEIWQGGSGKWYVNDTVELATPASKWYAPARLLNMSLVDYIKMMISRFKADSYFKNNMVVFSWSKQNDANNYKLWINKQSRENNWAV